MIQHLTKWTANDCIEKLQAIRRELDGIDHDDMSHAEAKIWDIVTDEKKGVSDQNKKNSRDTPSQTQPSA